MVSHPATATEILDREYFIIRGKLLEVAAALDRIERGKGAVSSDPRIEQFRKTLDILGGEGANRAEQMQLLFSLPYKPDWKKS